MRLRQNKYCIYKINTVYISQAKKFWKHGKRSKFQKRMPSQGSIVEVDNIDCSKNKQQNVIVDLIPSFKSHNDSH